MSHIVYRRWFGLFFCTITGFLYIVISQSINHIAMPGVPLYQPPFGMYGNILLGTLIAIVIGLVLAWPEGAALGVLFGSLVGAVVVSAATLLTGQNSPEMWGRKIAAVLLIFVPTAGGVAPLMILFRWLLNREETAYRDTRAFIFSPPLTRSVLPVVVILIAGAFGFLSLYNDLGRAVTPRMHALLQQGQNAQTAVAMPAPLRSEGVTQFQVKGRGPYTLEWDKDDTNKYQIPRPATPIFDQSVVIAHFDGGYLLVCMFPNKTGQPECRDF